MGRKTAQAVRNRISSVLSNLGNRQMGRSDSHFRLILGLPCTITINIPCFGGMDSMDSAQHSSSVEVHTALLHTQEPWCMISIGTGQKLNIQGGWTYIHAFHSNKPSFGTFWTLKILNLHPELNLQPWHLQQGSCVFASILMDRYNSQWVYNANVTLNTLAKLAAISRFC